MREKWRPHLCKTLLLTAFCYLGSGCGDITESQNTLEEISAGQTELPPPEKSAQLLIQKGQVASTSLGSLKNEQAIEQAVRRFLKKNPTLARIPSHELHLRWIRSIPARKVAPMWYVVFGQRVGPYDVVGSQLNITLKEINHQIRIVGWNMEWDPEAKQTTIPETLDTTGILRTAQKALTAEKMSVPLQSLSIKKTRIRRLDNQFRLTAEVKSQERHDFFTVYVDVISHAARIEDDRQFLTGHVRGQGLLTDPFDLGPPLEPRSLDRLDLKDLKLLVKPTWDYYYTDAEGAFAIPEDETVEELEVKLSGRWGQVTSPEHEILETFTNPEDPLEILLNPISPQEERTA